MVPFFVVVSDIVAQEPRNSFSNRPLSRTYVSIYGQKALLRHLIRFLHLYTENIQHNKTNKKGKGGKYFSQFEAGCYLGYCTGIHKNSNCYHHDR